LLNSDSEVFGAAFDNDSKFKEGEEGAMMLPEDDVLPVGCYIEYLYNGTNANTGTVFKNAFAGGPSRDDTALASYEQGPDYPSNWLMDDERHSLSFQIS
jgi:hypothetical protein